ncbi:MAG: zinc-binding dehydrogenase [Clostridium sp.]|uniref:zinc-binding dehydrogenase n=1 Tax=Clostridium sp. TaxID=1506 RepID=UPI003D6CC149
MRTKVAALYGKNDVRIREFDLPEIKDNEILAEVVSNGKCLSTWKAAILGSDHKRVPSNISEHPVIMGHEFAGKIVKVGAYWKDKYKEGDSFALQPAMNYKGSPYSPGYSYEFFGGDATYTILPNELMELDLLLKYNSSYFANASLSEPMSCIIGAFHANYHTTNYVYEHRMGIASGGNLALLASAGPMGLGAIDYAINNGTRTPSRIVVTDIDDNRLNRAKKLISPESAREKGIELIYVNVKNLENPKKYLMELTDNKGYDDVFAFAAIVEVVELAGSILGRDGCLNFFAGPTDNEFSTRFNFYNVHYSSTHIVGTSGGSLDDMKESLELSQKGIINPSFMITHIGGLNCVPNTVLNLPKIPGGKKMIYPHIEMELTAIEDFKKLGEKDEIFRKLAEIVERNNGLWCEEAETYLLKQKMVD